MSDADVYRKAAEIIVRDGKTENGLTGPRPEGGIRTARDVEQRLKDPSLPVCALGACARAQYELYGQLPEDPYDYDFIVPHESGHHWQLFMVNDTLGTSAEDIALLLKRRAEEVDGD